MEGAEVTQEVQAEVTQEPSAADAVAEMVGSRNFDFVLDKYKTDDISIEDAAFKQAEAYVDLQKRFGSFKGAPEDYQVNIREELKERGIEVNFDDPLMSQFVEWGKEVQLSQEGFDKVMDIYLMSQVANEEALEQWKAEEISSLKNGEARISNIQKWASANLPSDMVDSFLELGTSGKSIEALEHLIQMTRSSKVMPDGAESSPGLSKEDLLKMQFEKDEFGRRRIETDVAFGEKFRKMQNEFYSNQA